MNKSNYRKVIALAETDQEKEKFQLILQDQNEVADPYYGIEKGFKHCFDLLDNACNSIINHLTYGN